MHTTNTPSTFITVAPDSAATRGATPPVRDPPSLAARCHALIAGAPYALSSDDVLFTAFADARAIPPADRPAARAAFFAKGQPCLRASALTKTYGWGVHHDAEGRVALVGVDDPAYAALAAGRGPAGEALTVVAAMRGRR
ncbi:MAG: hypothetical protein RL071_3616 [Pseudomonadota bacterium]